MKKIVALLIVLIVSPAVNRAHALGLGVYADGGAGRMFLSDDTWGRQVHDNFVAGCGIVLETPLMRVGNAGYRLAFGFDRVFIPRTTRLATDYNDSYRVNLNNLLTYAFYKRERISLWVGPQIGFSVISGTLHSAGSKHMRDMALLPPVPANMRAAILARDAMSKNNRYMDYTLCLAPVLGMDYTAGEFVTVSGDLGFRGGVHLSARDPGSRYRYEGFCELAVLLRITKDPAPVEE